VQESGEVNILKTKNSVFVTARTPQQQHDMTKKRNLCNCLGHNCVDSFKSQARRIRSTAYL